MFKVSAQELNVIFGNILADKEKLLWACEHRYNQNVYVAPNFKSITGVNPEVMYANLRELFHNLADIHPENSFTQVIESLINRTPENPSVTYCLNTPNQQKIFVEDTLLCSLQHKYSPTSFFTGVMRIISEKEFIASKQHRPCSTPVLDSIFEKISEMQVIKPSPDSCGAVINNAFVPLTSREVECLQHLTEGHSSKVIARKLNISDRTVEIHIENIKRKTQTSTRIQLLSKLESIQSSLKI